ncbi:hypothetical protein [Flavobacterium sp. K5-23]|uniref:hypothetical protein n=1 Tax=Flavobacterium sp. K5-23 TaxID=2746225 RepID=UPI00200BF7CA|nr:hypothetical protein [Flavobacterium sp. K5-23]UQD55607.1 hypothetical protein FLAK523_04035 [Flavobacterium sp. K5-23]
MNGFKEAKEKKYMEKQSNNEHNPLQEWINTDAKLSKILKEIESQTKSHKEQANIAFHTLCEEYELPKYPDDIESREMIQVVDYHFYDPISVYEQLGIIRFTDQKEEDIRSQVLMAIFLVKNKLEFLFDDELDEYMGEDDLQGFGYKGEDIEVEMKPIKIGQSWFELGCTYFTKNVD